MLKEGWQDNIRDKNRMGYPDEAERDLRRIKMSSSYDKLNTTDKFFVNYCLAIHMKDNKANDLANEYLSDIENIFEYEDIKNYQVEYYKYLWLNVNVNYKNMSSSQIENIMMKVYEYNKNEDCYEHSLMALGNMYEKTSNGIKLLDCFKELMENSPNIEVKIINDFLVNLKKMDEGLYIKGLSISNYYRDKKILAN